MKISPVVGTPTIPNLSSTGLSAEKLAAIKAMASNQPTEEPKEETIALGQTPTSQTQRIVLSPNKTPEEILVAPKTQENAPPVAPEVLAVPQEPVNSDSVVQAKSDSVANATISPELAQLAKERRALQLEREQLAKDKEATKVNPTDALIQKLKASPLSVLQEHGITYEQLTNEILGQAQQPQQPPVDFNKFKDDLLKQIDERLAGKDSAQEEAVYSYMEQEVNKMSNLAPYKFIRESKSQKDVMDLVKRTWNETGEILTEEEAMNLVEAELREDAKRYAKLIGELEAPKEPVAISPEETTPAPKVQKSVTKTLTNKDAARPVMNRRQRAIAAALGQK